MSAFCQAPATETPTRGQVRETFQVRACSRNKKHNDRTAHTSRTGMSATFVVLRVSVLACWCVSVLACWYVSELGCLVGPFAPSNTMGVSSICIVSVLRFARWRHSISVHTVRSVSHGRGEGLPRILAKWPVMDLMRSVTLRGCRCFQQNCYS